MKTITCKAFGPAIALFLAAASVTNATWARDKIPPTVPGDFNAQPVSLSQINLKWAESTDNFGIERYHLMRDGRVVTRTNALSYEDSGLQAGSTYTYDLMADDGENYSYVSSLVVTIPVGSKMPNTAK